MNAQTLMGRLGPFRNQNRVIVEDQSTGDIIDAIVKAHKKYSPDYSKISSFFNGYSKRDTAKKIYNFLRKNVVYRIEPGSAQSVKSPAAILATGHGDCKHYSLFSGGVLQNLGIPFAYRFVSYKNDKIPQHVFVVIDPGTEKEIWIDPVISVFDYKKPYTYKTDRKMALYSISGIGQATIKQAKAAKKAAATKVQKQAAQTELKAARKAANKTFGQQLKKGSKVVLKVAAAPVRNAFLLLVKLNFAGLATKLTKAWEKAPTKLRTFWEGAGGQLEALKKAWESGSQKKRIFGTDDVIVGAEPVSVTAAAASPLLIKVANVLKDIGIDPAELVQVGKDALNQKAQELAKKALEPKAAKQASEQELAMQVEETKPSSADGPITVTKKPNFLPVLIGGLAVVYLITKK